LEIYAEEIVAHYEHPHNKGKMEGATASFHDNNPLCGDDITMYLKITDGIVSAIKFDGTGCAISIGSASMLTDLLKGKKVSEIAKMGPDDVIKMLGIDPGPVRLKCATLSLKATQKALHVYSERKEL
jgi:nitrogen fixation NifU-like protein